MATAMGKGCAVRCRTGTTDEWQLRVEENGACLVAIGACRHSRIRALCRAR